MHGEEQLTLSDLQAINELITRAFSGKTATSKREAEAACVLWGKFRRAINEAEQGGSS
jgi:hypothetical protein